MANREPLGLAFPGFCLAFSILVLERGSGSWVESLYFVFATTLAINYWISLDDDEETLLSILNGRYFSVGHFIIFFTLFFVNFEVLAFMYGALAYANSDRLRAERGLPPI